jgi:predicted lysophospholipase L1 biosynthesis ABC-type transport system permease subunit
MNIVLVSVGERTREIGPRKAVGARRRDILWLVLLEAVALSVGGGLVGICAGAGAAMALGTIFPALPVDVSWWSIWLAFGFAVWVGVLFGVYPAHKAAWLDPLAALRYEWPLIAENEGWSKATVRLSFAKILLARQLKGVVGFDQILDDTMGVAARLAAILGTSGT